MGNACVSFRASGDTLQKVSETEFYPLDVVLRGVGFVNGISNRFEMQGKEKEITFGLNIINFGARVYNPTIGRWDKVDPLAEKVFRVSPYAYANSNPPNMIDKDGRYAVSVHYQITYDVLILRGYSHKIADRIAHLASTYADHPTEGVRFADHFGHNLGAKGHLAYRKGIDYSLTKDSQEEYNSHWHSMMSDHEADEGMSKRTAMIRGLKFGWDNIFAQETKEDLGKLGQGLHALQDAYAHKGMSTAEHLDFKNLSAWKQTFGKDMYGNTKAASQITRSAIIVLDLITGKKVHLKHGDSLNLTGMSSEQFNRIAKMLLKQGFRGTIKNEED